MSSLHLKLLTITLVMLAFAGPGLVSCSKSKKNSSGAQSYSYGGPGSYWTNSMFADASFELLKFTDISATLPNLRVTGTYTRKAGFVLLTVGVSTDQAEVADGATTLGLEVPGVGMMLKPFDGAPGTNLIPMVRLGTCPSTTEEYRWIVTKTLPGDDPSNGSHEFYGKAFIRATDYARDTTPAYNLVTHGADGSPGYLGGGTCDQGIIDMGGGVSGFMSANGALILDENGKHIVAWKKGTITSAASLAGNYAGIVFQGSNNASYPIQVTMASNGDGTISETNITEISAGTVGTTSIGTLTMGTVNFPADGLVIGTVTLTANSIGTGNMACMFNGRIGGKKVLYCNAQEPATHTKLMSIVLVSR